MENVMKMEKLNGPLRILCPTVTITTQVFALPLPVSPIPHYFKANLIHSSFRHLVYISIITGNLSASYSIYIVT